MLCREDVGSVLTGGTHGSTFGGTPFVTSVALATLMTILGDKIPERAAQRGRELMDGLRGLQKTLPVIRDVRGRGLLIGIELSVPAGPVVDACREAGLLALTAGDKVLRLVPALIVESRDCVRALEIIEGALRGKPA
jgi:acetylornithine/N-succinyldiaminopimelate aminotransferase